MLHPALTARLDDWLAAGRPSTLDADRAAGLEALASWIAQHRADTGAAELIFVCTHNSRRSHLAQLWAQAAAWQLGLTGVRTHSAGTETTAFNPRSVRALQAQGLPIVDSGQREGGDNVVYEVSFGPTLPTSRNFSKVLGHPSLPAADFAAVMVCTSADAACPFVPGAAHRLSLPYRDPKESDDTPAEAATYRARSEEIGREQAWLMARVHALLG